MAGGGVAALGVKKERAAEYKGRMTWAVAMACLVAVVGGSIFGYDIGISGGVTSMDPFLEKFFPVVFRRKNSAHQNNYCKYNNQGLSAFTSSLYLAGLVSSLFASPVTRNYGRRANIACGGISFLIGVILNVAAVNLAMLILGRIMLGVGIGFGNQAVPASRCRPILPPPPAVPAPPPACSAVACSTRCGRGLLWPCDRDNPQV